MLAKKISYSFTESIAYIKNIILTGLLTVFPIWITWLVVKFLFDVMSAWGDPMVAWLSRNLREDLPYVSKWLGYDWFQSTLGVIVILLFLYALGKVTTWVVGRKLIELFDSIINRIPVVQTIYGSVKKLVTVLQQKPENVQRVVLIEFPSTEMKTVGLVTRTFADEDTGEELAAIYVPTTPNPTSGYLEIVPLKKVTSTNWTVDEAMTFIISGGAVSRDKINYTKSYPYVKDLKKELEK